MGEASCPKATIVVPVYNSARSIQRCLDSLLAQSERSIQVVCVNDGSTDDSLNVLRQIAQADDRVLVIDQENAGVSCARNAGIDVAEGETVFFVDADDYIDAQTVERVLHAMESADAEAADHLALVAHADLAQLDAGVEDAGQILDQLAEVHAAVGGEVEHDLGAVEGVFGLHQLHFQPVAGDALLAGVVGALFVLTVLAHPAHIHAVGHPGDGLEGLGHRCIGDLPHPLHHLAALYAPGRLDDDVITGLDGGVCGVKIIGLAVVLETDGYNFLHSIPLWGRIERI